MPAQFVREHAPESFAPLLAELHRKPLPTNFDRTVVGQGKSQAFGLIRRWSYRPYLSRNTWMRPELWQMLQDWAASELPAGFQWDAIQVNQDYASKPHRDKGNRGQSYIVGFGPYTGGALNVEGTAQDIRHRGHLFCGAEQEHWTEPWAGERFSLVFFSIEWPTKFAPGYSIQSRIVADGLEITDGYDKSVLILDRKGHIVRTVQAAEPRPWVGRVCSRGAPSRNPAFLPPSTPSA